MSSFHIVIISFFSPNFCVLLAVDTGHLWTPGMYKDVWTHHSIGGNAKFVSRVLDNLYNATILLHACFTCRTMPFAPLSHLYWIGSTNTDDALLDISYVRSCERFLVLSGQPCQFIPSICKNKICQY